MKTLTQVVAEVSAARTPTTQTFTLQTLDGAGNSVPNGIVMFPPAVGATSVVDNGDGTFTFGRPHAGDAASYIIMSAAAGYSSRTSVLQLLAQDVEPLIGGFDIPPDSGGTLTSTPTPSGYGYASSAEFNAAKTQLEVLRVALVTLGVLD